ncbi:hypothetical protein [Aurantiacibacter marinus]|uniref:Septum formation-related domain-containing protein n=1 Tax=Aurantiacibacter marinus TaxID=874156 RepID=A0A0H0XK14_9SPHN|nr:hypothetical protein [Aurantiacibacter marinus]KLI62933.1 hypothetical protein AAV99_12825 [Aurantiacibacter marinus]
MKAKALGSALPLTLLAACAAAQSDTSTRDIAATDLVRVLEPCGITAPGMPGNDEHAHLRFGDGPVRPCNPISPDNAEFACQLKDGEVIEDPDYPHDEERAVWAAPAITISDLQCRDLKGDSSEVSCDFIAAHDGFEQRVSGHRFTHWYSTAHDEMSGHSYGDTLWRTDASCLAHFRFGRLTG